jgi:glyoxylase-like metal-dependent hydrolase (beta-lactamase superfamily II)
MIRPWFDTLEMGDGITLIRERYVPTDIRCNLWHVRGRQRDVLIDTGMGLVPLAEELSLLRERPVVAVATHTHFDHVGGHHQFAERLVHRAEAPVLAEPDDRETVWDRYLGAVSLVPPADSEVDLSRWHVPAAPATRVLEHGDVIDLGDRHLEVHHLPGHSPGSICLVERATGTVFTGDVIYDGMLFDRLHHSDPEVYRKSLKRLLELPGRVYHGGHEGSFGRDRLELLVDDYLNRRRPTGP